jgi:hypothetical protein
MSRVAMRTAVAEFFAQASLQFVGQVYSARPEVLSEQAYEANRMGEAVASDNGSSAVLVVGIPSDDRMRRADTGRGAVNDSHIYRIAMEVFFASTGGDAVAAQNDYDTVVDQMVNLIRSNATLNASATVWSAGEYEQGVQHQQGEPYTDADGLTVFIPGVVKFEAWEWVAGNV